MPDDDGDDDDYDDDVDGDDDDDDDDEDDDVDGDGSNSNHNDRAGGVNSCLSCDSIGSGNVCCNGCGGMIMEVVEWLW